MIDPLFLDLESLPFVLLDDRRLLPSDPCVYFAIDSSGEVLYIGRAVNLKARWANHHHWDALNSMEGVRIAYLSIPHASLDQVEQSMIEWFDPLLNGAQDKVRHTRKVSIPVHLTDQDLKWLQSLADSAGTSLAIQAREAIHLGLNARTDQMNRLLIGRYSCLDEAEIADLLENEYC